jgi:hypothetical protein
MLQEPGQFASERGWTRRILCPGVQGQRNTSSCGLYAAMTFATVAARRNPETLPWRQADMEPYYRAFICAMLQQGTLAPAGWDDETGWGLLNETGRRLLNTS